MSDFIFMNEAIKEAEKAREVNGYRVGTVIVCGEEILAKAYSLESCVFKHAEEHAFLRCMGHGFDLSRATLYSTMEPCNFRKSGKMTCTDLIIEKRIGKVFFGVFDPDKNGGFLKLKENGIDVVHFSDFEDICKKLTPKLFGGETI